MGEVYRARDTRLGRDVAIKVLPADLAGDPELVARFEREARAISSLNHPNICTLFDVGREDGVEYLVMELIEGETLFARLKSGPLPTTELLRLGGQVAAALDRAHRAGVIHRDLKPGNIMLTKTGAKLMDFGLARATIPGPASPATSPGGLSQSPTRSQPLTARGTVVGTFQYLAPEQLEGREADARSDLWGLGCVLYEMATGRPAFEGRSQASLIAAIMSAEPAPISQLSPLSPPALDRLIRGCLAKDPEERVQTAHDVRLQLQWIAEGGSQAGVPPALATRRRGRERLAWTVAGAAAVIALTLAVLVMRPAPPANAVTFELTPPPQIKSLGFPRLSPDGRWLAFQAEDSSGNTSLWVRPLGALAARRLEGTESASRPFWSPDSRSLAFFCQGSLKRLAIAGGPPVALCDALSGSDGTWSPSGVILFDGGPTDSIRRVPATGGSPVAASRVDRMAGELSCAWPQFLPDGDHFLYLAFGHGEVRTLKIGTLKSLEARVVGQVASRCEYSAGHVLSVRSGMLMAQPFDLRSLRMRGEPTPVAQDVEGSAMGGAGFSTSSDGTLVFKSGGDADAKILTWTDRAGRTLGTVGPAAHYYGPVLSPDASQLAVAISNPARGVGDIWIWDLARKLGSRLTYETFDAFSPLWMPGGRSIVFSLRNGPGSDLVVRSIGAGARDSILLHATTEKAPDSWSPDGRTLLLTSTRTDATYWRIEALSLADSVRVTPLTSTKFGEYEAHFSPDGRQMAYVSWESGSEEVYLANYPLSGGKWRISTAGGREPAWRGDGRELYYLDNSSRICAVEIGPGPVPKISLPAPLFRAAELDPEFSGGNRYVVTRDGQRFLLVNRARGTSNGATTVVLNWPAAQLSR
jgi:serine/threonine protein kinase